MINKCKKTIIILTMIFAALTSFCAEKKSIVCVSFPAFDWVNNILGENVGNWNVTLLQNKGTDSHSWQPSFADIARISECDMFVYNGGESDSWADKALQNVKKQNQIVVNLMNELGEHIHEEEIVEGMQAEDEHHHHHEHGEHHHDEDEDDEEEIEYDEHIWLSLHNAITLTEAITQRIAAIDSEHEELYKHNCADYVKQLSALNEEYHQLMKNAPCKTILFGDRFPFRYMAEDYGLTYYAAFAGCSAESEASFETIIFLSKKIDELGLKCILTIEKSDKKLAKTIAANTKQKKLAILELDSLQSVNMKDIKKGKSYIKVMRGNLDILSAALTAAEPQLMPQKERK